MTKAQTKAGRLRQKRSVGRPRKDGMREPNGQLSRSGIHHEPANVIALDARRRHLGLDPEQCKDQRAATFIGRLAMAGREGGLSSEQYEAALKFQALNNEMLKTIQSPAAYYERSGASQNVETDEYAKWVRRTKERFSAASYALFEAQQAHRSDNIVSVVNLCILQDHFDFAMLGALRIACNVLARHFKLDSASR